MTESPLRFHWRLSQGGEQRIPTRAHQASLAATGLPELDPQTRFCLAAEEAGIDSLLVDFGWAKPDPILLSAALGMRTTRIKFIVAYRSGLICPTSFVQQLNTLSALIDGRFGINVVAGSAPEEQRYYGDFLPHDERYARTEEMLAVCNAFWRGGAVDYDGAYYRVERGKLNTPFVASSGARAPELYIAGNSEQARRLAISEGSCWMMIAEAPQRVAARSAAVVAAGKTVGVRLSVVARRTHAEAVAAAREIAAASHDGFDSAAAEQRFAQSCDSVAMRTTYATAEQEWLTPYLWTGLVRKFGAPAIALVGSAEEVAEGILAFRDAGVSQFIFSGWPKLEEMQFFGAEVVPRVREREREQHEHLCA